jgi:hypothetical protein
LQAKHKGLEKLPQPGAFSGTAIQAQQGMVSPSKILRAMRSPAVERAPQQRARARPAHQTTMTLEYGAQEDPNFNDKLDHMQQTLKATVERVSGWRVGWCSSN